MTHTEHKEKATVEYSSRRKRSLHRKRLMDIDKSANPDQLPPGTPIAVYSRVSSEEQVHGYSLDAQVNACNVFASQRKWKIVKYYSDPGHSAKDDNRPAFSQMIRDAEDGQFKTIIFHKLDRFSRNIENTLRYFRDLNSWEVLLEQHKVGSVFGRIHRLGSVILCHLGEKHSSRKDRIENGLENASGLCGNLKVRQFAFLFDANNMSRHHTPNLR